MAVALIPRNGRPTSWMNQHVDAHWLAMVGGQGYTVSGTHWTAAVTVEDDDIAPHACWPAGDHGHLINNMRSGYAVVIGARGRSTTKFDTRWRTAPEMDGVADLLGNGQLL